MRSYPFVRLLGVLVLFLVFNLAGCKKKSKAPTESEDIVQSDTTNVFRNANLHFQTGFEEGCYTTGESSSYVDIKGKDNSLDSLNDFVSDLEANPIGYFTIQYQGGDTSQRYARIIEDSTHPDNHVLVYWLKHVNVDPDASYGGKGRIQANLYKNIQLTEMGYKFRMYFHEDWKILTSAIDKTGWLIMAEFWNNAAWYENFGFRIHITLGKDVGINESLHFGLGAETKDTGSWEGLWHEKSDFNIPIAQWLDCEVYFKEGDADTGRFFFAVTTPDQIRTVIFDVQNFTHHPTDPSPDGLKDFNPLKLYSQNTNINRVREAGGVLQIYWDDFKLYTF